MSYYKNKIAITVASIILSNIASQAETVEYYVDGTKIGEATNNTSLVWSNPPSGTHTVAAKALDAYGVILYSKTTTCK